MKTNIIPIAPCSEQESISFAMVKGIEKDSIIIETEDGIFKSTKAFSCLVSPVADDKVLVSRQDKKFYVLAILERPEKSDMTLDFPGSVAIKAGQGQIAAEAADKITLLSLDEIETISPNFSLTAGKGIISSDELKIKSENIETHSTEVKLFAKNICLLVDQWIQHAKNITRSVEGIETLNIGNLIQNIKKTLTIRSCYSTITAKKDIKIDGERIHMG